MPQQEHKIQKFN